MRSEVKGQSMNATLPVTHSVSPLRAETEISGYKPRPGMPQCGCLLMLAALSIFAAPSAHAARYVFDQKRTEVRFAYKMAYSTQRGRFTKVSGTLDYNPASPEKSRVSASIDAASLSAGEAYVENELKGAAFFNVKAAPVISFKSLIVKPRSPSAAEISGEITINGTTRPVTLNVSIAPHDDPALKFGRGAQRFVAKTRILRSGFNMTKFMSVIDDEVELEIDAIVRPR
jgi:polyisoprenoid-binding protein YceI